MPDMDGMAVLGELKASQELADIPVILVSVAETRETGYALGASDYLMKPIDREHFGSIVKKYKSGQQPSSVLVIEDDSAIREMMRKTLEGEGWSVAEAGDGQVGLELVRESRPDLILLDLLMPNMDGFEFVSELRDHHRWRYIPVIVVTAKDLTPEERTRLKGQVESVVRKGAYTGSKLVTEIRNCLVGHVASTATQPKSRETSRDRAGKTHG